MKEFLTTGIIIISSLLGATLIISNVNASPSCYGVDQRGNTIDLSSLCSPSSNPKSIPSSPVNINVNPEETAGSNENQEPKFSTREEAEKDLQACFSSPTCTEMIGGESQPQRTPHQIRIDQVLNGGRINPN